MAHPVTDPVYVERPRIRCSRPRCRKLAEPDGQREPLCWPHRREVLHAEARAIVATGKCPRCGQALRW